MKSNSYRRLLNKHSAIFGLAIAAGLMAAWSAQAYLADKAAQIERNAQVPQVERVVAAYDLAAGTVLSSDDLAVRLFPTSLVSSDSLGPIDYSLLEGKVLRASLQSGDVIVPSHVKQAGSQAFSSQLFKGRRAITMPVDAINSVSGLLQPGDLIDLYVSFEYDRRRITAPLLQGVLVLATGRMTQEDAEGSEFGGQYSADSYHTVTLDTDPEDAVKLVAARESGTITAVLRHPTDQLASTKASRGDLATLLGVNRSGPIATPRATVLYGNTTPRRVPRLQAPDPNNRVSTGVFDLPYTPTISSLGRFNPAPQFMNDALMESEEQP